MEQNRTIDDKFIEVPKETKEELKVFCDAMVCTERGERARCYLDIFKYCKLYEGYTSKK